MRDTSGLIIPGSGGVDDDLSTGSLNGLLLESNMDRLFSIINSIFKDMNRIETVDLSDSWKLYRRFTDVLLLFGELSPREEAVLEAYGIKSDRGELKEIFEQEPGILDVLAELPEEVMKYFPPDTSLELEVFRDPEDPSLPEISVWIVTSLPVGEALRRLEEFEEGWWLDRIERTGGRLCVLIRSTQREDLTG